MKKGTKLYQAAEAVKAALERLSALYTDETERKIEGSLAERLPDSLAEVCGEIDEIREFLGEAVEQFDALADHVQEAMAQAEALDLSDTHRSILSQMRKGEW